MKRINNRTKSVKTEHKTTTAESWFLYNEEMEINRKAPKILIAIFLVGFSFLAIRFLFGGPEDSWICDHGQWVKHGNPKTPMPQVDCQK